MSLKFTGELCMMTMKNYAKLGPELTGHLKIDTRSLFYWCQLKLTLIKSRVAVNVMLFFTSLIIF